MVCTTVRNGFECPFMTKKGCSYNGGICHEIVEHCNGCNRSTEYASRWYCSACPDPSLKWKTREETSNVAFDRQINPALLKGRGFPSTPNSAIGPALIHLSDFSSYFPLTYFVSTR
ncbi:MAG: PxxKW family cysteine-rich protein [Deltaproteobacteria bacterium]|nr:PxxKW family cysteine-rich protein [Deltaproteobacteria bacterium]